MGTEKKYKLNKHEILKKSDNFNKIFKQGITKPGHHVSIIYKDSDFRKIGFAISKKVQKSVKRNRQKRLLREIYRLNKHLFPENKYFILFSRGTSDNFLELQREILTLLHNI